MKDKIEEQDNLINTLSNKFLANQMLQDLMMMKDAGFIICLYKLSNNTFISMSDSCLDAWGYTKEEMIGKRYADFIHPEDLESSNKVAVDNFIKPKELTTIKNFKNRYIHKNGQIIYNNWVVSKPSNGYSLCLCQYSIIPFTDSYYYNDESFNKTLELFAKGEISDIKFEQMLEFIDKGEVNIGKNGGVYISIELLAPFLFKIKCKMDPGAVLDKHGHSNFLEGFHLINGTLIDQITNNLLTPAEPKVYKIGEIHHLKAGPKGALMNIFGFLLK